MNVHPSQQKKKKRRAVRFRNSSSDVAQALSADDSSPDVRSEIGVCVEAVEEPASPPPPHAKLVVTETVAAKMRMLLVCTPPVAKVPLSSIGKRLRSA